MLKGVAPFTVFTIHSLKSRLYFLQKAFCPSLSPPNSEKMSSRRGGGRLSGAVNREKFQMEQLGQNVDSLSLDDGGEWEEVARKHKNRGGSSSARPQGPQTSNPRPWGGNAGSATARGFANSSVPIGRGNPRPQNFNMDVGSNNIQHYSAPQAVVQPPLEHGWNWKARPGATRGAQVMDNLNAETQKEDDIEVDDESDADAIDDSDDDLLSDEFDSDASQESHETRKKNRWFWKFFEMLDSLSIEEISEPERQWHCPACQGGPGAIDWYRGLQPLITHAKTKGTTRVKMHRELGKLLDEELRRRGTSVVPAGEMFGKWEGLQFEEKDCQILWPPMVVIMNTRLEQDANEKWLGMGNQELIEYFSSYAAVKARHSYGPQGHRGMSVLMFESSAAGYFEAERLHKHFADEGTDRDAWERRKNLFLPGGKRQLYGYMAVKEDLDNFNRHSPAKSRLKFEMRSYQEMVVQQLKQMSEDNQLLIWYKNKMERERRLKNALEESFGKVSEKLRQTMVDNILVQEKIKLQHEQNKAEMDYQEQFFNEQIKIIHQAREAKEVDFEKLQQQEREKVEQSNTSPVNTEECRRRADEISNLLKIKDEGREVFVAEKDKLIKNHVERMSAMKQRHWKEEVELEKEFDDELNSLMEKYGPKAN